MGRKSRAKAEQRRKVASAEEWTPFFLADTVKTNPEADKLISVLGVQRERGTIYVNSIYSVEVKEITTPIGRGRELSIKRRDRQIIRDWRHMQRIKNELCGKDWEGVELYPAEERLVDTANQYYMFCFPPPFRFPFGYNHRLVVNQGVAGSVQRPFKENERPADAYETITAEVVREVRDKERNKRQSG